MFHILYPFGPTRKRVGHVGAYMVFSLSIYTSLGFLNTNIIGIISTLALNAKRNAPFLKGLMWLEYGLREASGKTAIIALFANLSFRRV